MRNTRNLKLYRMVVASLCMALGLVLPFLTAQLPDIGNMLLPMHLPIFLCGAICGSFYGALVGATTPILRSLLFSRPAIYPNAMTMAFELAAYGFLIGFFLRLLVKKTIPRLYIALVLSMLGGRVVWACAKTTLFFLGEIKFSFGLFLSDGFITAFPGIIIQLILVPAIVAALDPAYRRRTNS